MDIALMYKAWKKSNNHTPEEKALAQERYSKCKNLIKVGKLEVCGGCFCTMSWNGEPYGKPYVADCPCVTQENENKE